MRNLHEVVARARLEKFVEAMRLGFPLVDAREEAAREATRVERELRASRAT